MNVYIVIATVILTNNEYIARVYSSKESAETFVKYKEDNENYLAEAIEENPLFFYTIVEQELQD